ncbi:hypothetical protein [Mycobacterium mantenii]|uniref:hypothetical protein n=1 Tax=Mycobacterium mantenii TaxID=560555 RepID=UPI001F5FFA1F|nr:hypothetical protein [Mycobacterium mantenii]
MNAAPNSSSRRCFSSLRESQPGTTQMTAANSTPLTDGASAAVIASGERAAELGIEPLARVVSSAVYGIDPLIMGLAPASWTSDMSVCSGVRPARRTAIGIAHTV